MAESTLYRRCKTPSGWKRFPAAFGKNGRVRPGYVQVGTEQVLYQTGTYEIRATKDGKRVWVAAGDLASEALGTLQRHQRQNEAKEQAEGAGLVIADEKPREKTLTEWSTAFVQDAEHRGSHEAAAMNRRNTEQFLRLVKKDFPSQIERADLFHFMTGLRKAGNSDRTIFNKFLRVKSFLKFAGVPASVFPPRPKYEKKLPTTYSPEEFKAILEAAEPRLRLVLSVALKCGLREKEIMHLQWSDISEHTSTLRVKGKPLWGFKVKDSEERDVPVPSDLLKELRRWHESQPEKELLFGTAKDRPDGHLLRTLKRTAKDAGLNCNRCEGCKASVNECQDWQLHKFRRSYLTTLLRNGLDLRTVQALAGHSDLASTMRYLRPASATETHAKINEIQWT